MSEPIKIFLFPSPWSGCATAPLLKFKKYPGCDFGVQSWSKKQNFLLLLLQPWFPPARAALGGWSGRKWNFFSSFFTPGRRGTQQGSPAQTCCFQALVFQNKHNTKTWFSSQILSWSSLGQPSGISVTFSCGFYTCVSAEMFFLFLSKPCTASRD